MESSTTLLATPFNLPIIATSDQTIATVWCLKGYILRKLISILGDGDDIHLQFSPTAFKIVNNFQDEAITGTDTSNVSNSIIDVSITNNNNIIDIQEYVRYIPPTSSWFNVQVEKSKLEDALKCIRTGDGKMELRLVKTPLGDYNLHLKYYSLKGQTPVHEIPVLRLLGPEIVETVNHTRIAEINSSSLMDICEKAADNINSSYCKVTLSIVDDRAVAVYVSLYSNSSIIASVVWCSVPIEGRKIVEYATQYYHRNVFKRLAPLKTSFNKNRFSLYVVYPNASTNYQTPVIGNGWEVSNVTSPEFFGKTSSFHLIVGGIVNGVEFKFILI